MTESRGNWIYCPKCHHKMFLDLEGKFGIEIKCTSCKRIIRMTEKEWKIVAEKQNKMTD